MKKLLFLAVLLGCFLGLAACGDDKDDPQLAKTAEITYYLNYNELTEAGNVIVYYVGDNGETKFEALSAGRSAWTKTVTINRFPAKVGIQLAISTKESADLTKATYNVKTDASIKVQVKEGANIKGTFTNSETMIVGELSKEAVLSTLKNFDGREYGYTLTADGSASRTAMNLK